MEDENEQEETPQDQEPEKKTTLFTSIALIILALIVAALIGYIVYSSSTSKLFTEGTQQETTPQTQEMDVFVQAAEQNAQQQQEALAAAEEELSEKEALLTNGLAELENQSCENALEIATTQKVVLTKEINDLTTVGNKIENNSTFAIDVCRQLNPGLSKPECETRIEGSAQEAQESIVEMEAMVEELDERIKAGCSETDESTQINEQETAETLSEE